MDVAFTFTETTRTLCATVLASMLALLGACGGNGAPGADGLTARLLVSAESPGAQCEAGGVRIDAGAA